MAYTEKSRFKFQPKLPSDPKELRELRKRNNPDDDPVGVFTGRCQHCGSKDLWDDNWAYGCNACGAMLGSN